MSDNHKRLRREFPGLVTLVAIGSRIGFVLSLLLLLARAGNLYVLVAIFTLTFLGTIATLPADNER